LALALGLLSMLAGRAQAHLPTAVNVSGPILTDTVWTAAGSPYILTGTVTVTPGVTLTVEPGVTVMGQSGTSLAVGGHLAAAGLVTKPITFTSAADSGPGQWEGIAIDGSAHLDQAVVRYGNAGNIGVGGDAGGPVLLENSIISGSAGYGVQVYVHTWHRLQMANVTFTANISNHVVIIERDFNSRFLTDDVTLTAQTGLEGYVITPNPNTMAPVVPAGMTLTAEPGVTMMFTLIGGLVVEGHLEAVGTVTKPITFTSILDSSPGQYESIFVGGSARLEHTVIRYGYVNLAIGWWGSSPGPVMLKNSVISDSVVASMWVYADALHRLQMEDVTFRGNSSKRILIDGLGGHDTLIADATLTDQPGLEGYEIYDDTIILSVPQGITLTVEPGVTMMFPRRFYVEGHLEAVGTVTNPITFTSVTDSSLTDWEAIVVPGTAHLDHTVIRHAWNPAVYVWDGWPGPDPPGPSSDRILIENSTISDNGYPLLIEWEAAHKLQLSNVTFRDNGSNHAMVFAMPLSDYPQDDVTLVPHTGLEGYEVYEDIVVPNGITLTIKPGVSLRILSQTGLSVNGNLEALGTVTQPITFTSFLDSGPGQWDGLAFGDGLQNGSGHLSHATVRYGGANIEVNNPSSGRQVLIENSQVHDAEYFGLFVLNGHVTATCTAFANNSVGVHFGSTGSVTTTIFSSSFVSNTLEGLDNDNPAQVDARYNWWGDASGPSGIGPGTGDAVSGNTLYDPWLADLPFCLASNWLYLPLMVR
jgi:hypothetical protein